ncbi:MAG: glycosyltransferase family 2 protein [Lachnospirales bacterium]
MTLIDIVSTIVVWFNFLVFFYMIFINIVYTILLLGSIKEMYIYRQKTKHWNDIDLINSNHTPPLSILVPCHNEEDTIVDNVNALLNLIYREYEIIIINDGSKDDTMKILIESFDFVPSEMPYRVQLKTEEVKEIYISSLYDNIVLVDKVNGGKADALNTGVNLCKYPIFTAIDADSIIERTSLTKVVRPFVLDPTVVASGGIVRPINDSEVEGGLLKEVVLPTNNLARFQTVEYLRAFLFGRVSWSAINSLLIVSGAFGVFKKDIIIKAGGYVKDSLGEDMELVTRLHRILRREKSEYKIVFVPDPVCWTLVPEDLKTLRAQRKRWHKGLIDTVTDHKSVIFNPKYGTVGMLGMPYYFLVEVFGVGVEVFGYIVMIISFVLGFINLQFFLMFMCVSVLYGVFLSLGAVFLEQYNTNKYKKVSEYLWLVLFAILENFGYRQLITVWRFNATFKNSKSKKEREWGDMKRRKFSENADDIINDNDEDEII